MFRGFNDQRLKKRARTCRTEATLKISMLQCVLRQAGGIYEMSENVPENPEARAPSAGATVICLGADDDQRRGCDLPVSDLLEVVR